VYGNESILSILYNTEDIKHVNTSNTGVPIASCNIYDATFSHALLPRIFPAAYGGDIPAIINLPLCGVKCAAENVDARAILIAEVSHSISLYKISNNTVLYMGISFSYQSRPVSGLPHFIQAI